MTVSHFPSLSDPRADQIFLAEGLSLSLGPRKTSQTGNAHVWCLSANDRDEEMCPKRIFLMLAELYGADVYPCGPLFHYVNQRGVIELDRPLVRVPFSYSTSTVADVLVLDNWCYPPRPHGGHAGPWVQLMGLVWHPFLPSRWLSIPCGKRVDSC